MTHDDAEQRDPEFTNDWFTKTGKQNLDALLPELKPKRALEIGCFEGQCSYYLANAMCRTGKAELVCIDTWEGGFDNKSVGEDMAAVERRFDSNMNLAKKRHGNLLTLTKAKGNSDTKLAELLCDRGKDYFDLIYVDGSHESADVLLDAALGIRLLKPGGYMVFDDYLWSPIFTNIPGGCDLLRTPKLAVDAFVNIYIRQIQIDMRFSGYQFYIRKRH